MFGLFLLLCYSNNSSNSSTVPGRSESCAISRKSSFVAHGSGLSDSDEFLDFQYSTIQLMWNFPFNNYLALTTKLHKFQAHSSSRM